MADQLDSKLILCQERYLLIMSVNLGRLEIYDVLDINNIVLLKPGVNLKGFKTG